MKATQAAVLFALLVVTAMTHDMTKQHLVAAKKMDWYFWLTDQFFLWLWTFVMMFIVPIGWICTFFNAPHIYYDMFDGLVTGGLRLGIMQ